LIRWARTAGYQLVLCRRSGRLRCLRRFGRRADSTRPVGPIPSPRHGHPLVPDRPRPHRRIAVPPDALDRGGGRRGGGCGAVVQGAVGQVFASPGLPSIPFSQQLRTAVVRLRPARAAARRLCVPCTRFGERHLAVSLRPPASVPKLSPGRAERGRNEIRTREGLPQHAFRRVTAWSVVEQGCADLRCNGRLTGIRTAMNADEWDQD